MTRTPVPEAKLVETQAGLKPEGDGWFVVNVAEAMSIGIEDDQYGFIFEGALNSFPHFGINVRVLSPGKPAAMYHAEAGQEAFLVLDGECTLIVEGEERHLRRWDFMHCPPHTAHVIVGAGERPCVVLMVGARNAGDELVYPACEAAARHGASVKRDTRDEREAYADWSPPTPRRYPWPPAAA
jgi:uncharacterized cupin superfamily protein